MTTQQIDATQDLPVMISDAAWQSIHPFLKTLPTVYVGAPEDCRRFLSALAWITKEGATWRLKSDIGDSSMPGSFFSKILAMTPVGAVSPRTFAPQ